MTLPVHLFRVTYKRGTGRRLSSRDRGGGTLATLAGAEERKQDILRKYPDADVKIYTTFCNWIEVT